MSIPLGTFPIDHVVEGEIITIEDSGVLTDFNLDQLVHVPSSELSIHKIYHRKTAIGSFDFRQRRTR